MYCCLCSVIVSLLVYSFLKHSFCDVLHSRCLSTPHRACCSPASHNPPLSLPGTVRALQRGNKKKKRTQEIVEILAYFLLPQSFLESSPPPSPFPHPNDTYFL
eukprot:TRINITY_DN4026_c0_g1_i1.p1 TRINITY_DN4026_c0_g1~~TRINITY_DN4026_c0_g1_i1.p1  ORF type:complete len:103 (+),score=5.43 TRINITY_DN4026_c0_g1_i1:387-695(+)